MAVIECPAPGCSEQVVENWLTCPRCKCPIQVLRQAAAAASSRAPPPVDEDEDQAAEAMRDRIQENDEAHDAEPPLPPLPPENKPVEDLEMRDRLFLVGKGTMGLGVGFGLGVPILLGSPALASFCGVAAITLLLAGWGIQRLAQRS